MWEMGDQRGCISSLSGYRVLNGEGKKWGGVVERGPGEGLFQGGQGNPVWELAGASEKEREPGRAEHVSHHLRAVEFPLFWGEACEDAVGLRLVGDA